MLKWLWPGSGDTAFKLLQHDCVHLVKARRTSAQPEPIGHSWSVEAGKLRVGANRRQVRLRLAVALRRAAIQQALLGFRARLFTRPLEHVAEVGVEAALVGEQNVINQVH